MAYMFIILQNVDIATLRQSYIATAYISLLSPWRYGTLRILSSHERASLGEAQYSRLDPSGDSVDTVDLTVDSIEQLPFGVEHYYIPLLTRGL